MLRVVIGRRTYTSVELHTTNRLQSGHLFKLKSDAKCVRNLKKERANSQNGEPKFLTNLGEEKKNK